MNGMWYDCVRDGEHATVHVRDNIGIYGDTGAGLIEAIGDAPSVTCIINSGGGCSNAAFLVADVLRQRDTRVHVRGRAFSAAVTIVLAGKRRTTTPDAKWMIHEPVRSVLGNARDLRFAAETLDPLRTRLRDFIAERTSQPAELVESWLATDHYMTAEQALASGFVHQLIAEEPAPSTMLAALDATADGETPDQMMFRKFLRAFGSFDVRNKPAFARDVAAWVECNVQQI